MFARRKNKNAFETILLTLQFRTAKCLFSVCLISMFTQFIENKSNKSVLLIREFETQLKFKMHIRFQPPISYKCFTWSMNLKLIIFM